MTRKEALTRAQNAVLDARKIIEKKDIGPKAMAALDNHLIDAQDALLNIHFRPCKHTEITATKFNNSGVVGSPFILIAATCDDCGARWMAGEGWVE